MMFRIKPITLIFLGAVYAATTASRSNVATLTLRTASFRLRNKGNDET
jgi:hypothetical protein